MTRDPSEAPRPEPGDSPPPSRLERAWAALAPIVAAAFIDLVDLATPGAPGVVLGALLGTPLGWWLARRAGLPPGRALALGVAAGVYCAAPFTSPLPLATIVAAFLRFLASGEARSAGS